MTVVLVSGLYKGMILVAPEKWRVEMNKVVNIYMCWYNKWHWYIKTRQRLREICKLFYLKTLLCFIVYIDEEKNQCIFYWSGGDNLPAIQRPKLAMYSAIPRKNKFPPHFFCPSKSLLGFWCVRRISESMSNRIRKA